MRSGVSMNQISALWTAIGASAVTAAAMMFVPVGTLENIIGATGLSELVPSVAAPLGDPARAVIAFFTGAIVLALLSVLLLRQDISRHFAETEKVGTQGSFEDRPGLITWPNMPWMKSEGDITDLSDLPRLKNGDAHPDAPPRRPLSAQQDLEVIDFATIELSPHAVAANVAPRIEIEETEAAAGNSVNKGTTQVTEAEGILMTKSDIQPTLAEMVAQLEAAVAHRQAQLAQLETVSDSLDADRTDKGRTGRIEVKRQAYEQTQEQHPEPFRAERPILEAVPAVVKDDDIDSALAAALATLHRMNGTNC